MNKLTPEAIKAQLNNYHRPAAKEEPMVWSVWEDGEITLEKGGELFGLRNLHSIYGGLEKSLPQELFPVREKHHARLFVNTEAEARAVRDFIEAQLD